MTRTFPKMILGNLLIYVSISTCVAQEKKIYLNFYTGMASFKTHITQLEGNQFKSANIYSLAPTGVSLGIEFLKNSFLDIQFGTQTFYNDYLYISGDTYSQKEWSSVIFASNYGLRFKYEYSLSKSIKLSPFVGLSTSQINQKEGTSTTFRMQSKSRGETYVDGVLTESYSDSLYSKTDYLSNRVSGVVFGGELAYHFKSNIGIYFAYSFFYNSKYYTTQYGEYRRTNTPIQRANTSFGKSGHFYQLGLRYHIFNTVKTEKKKA